MKISQLAKLCRGKKDVYIFGHVSPDGDCIGSTLALYLLLEMQEINTTLILQDVPTTYDFLNLEHVVDTVPENIEVALVLDCGDFSRLGIYEEAVKNAHCIVNIDHHISNTFFGHHQMINVHASSTCEVVYDMLDDETMVNEDVAKALYTGIIYDTGVFKHSSTTERTHFIAGKLIRYGFDFTEIINRLFYYKSIRSLQAYSKVIGNISSYANNQIVVSKLERNEIDELGIEKHHVEGVVQMLNEIEGTACAVFIFEKESGLFKVSLRSRGEVDVCHVAQQFDGGGHKKASGCTSSKSLENLIDELVTLIKEQILIEA